MQHSRVSGPNTPTSVDVGPRFPPTPGVSSDGCRFQIPSPHTPTAPSGKYLYIFFQVEWKSIVMVCTPVLKTFNLELYVINVKKHNLHSF